MMDPKDFGHGDGDPAIPASYSDSLARIADALEVIVLRGMGSDRIHAGTSGHRPIDALRAIENRIAKHAVARETSPTIVDRRVRDVEASLRARSELDPFDDHTSDDYARAQAFRDAADEIKLAISGA